MGLSVAKKKSILIVVLVILLSGLTLFLVYPTDPNSQKTGGFSTLVQHQIVSIKVQSTKALTIQIEKKSNHWYLTSPINRRADSSRIAIFLAVLTLPRKTIYSAEEVNLKELGLDQPAGTLTLNQQQFFFGNTDFSGKNRYLMHNNQITLIPDLVFPLFKNGLSGVAQLQLAPAEKLIGIHSSSWTLNKSSNKWTSNEIPTIEAEKIAAAWTKQRARDILPWPLENISPLKTGRKFTLFFQYSSGIKSTLSIYKLDELAVIHPKDSDYALVIDSEQFSMLYITPESSAEHV